MTTFIRTQSDNMDFQSLVDLLDKEFGERDGNQHSFYDQFNKVINIRNAIVFYKKTVEIKRMFVLPGYRGHGAGFNILNELELWAAELNYRQCILETGKKQPEALRLYQKAGYKVIKNYGQYENVENSVCMKKDIL
jgi:putative acetyltransferase